jgi:phage terminase large subunit
MILTDSFKLIADLDYRIRIVQGGSSASKTYSILQKLILKAIYSKETKLVSIVTDTHPNMSKGAYRDFLRIVDEDEIKYTGTKSPLEITINKWTFEFFGLDDETKARGGRRDILFINEANRIKWETARQLIMRTRDTVYIDYNPDAEFWVHSKYLNKPDTDFVIVTYKDNQACPQSSIDEIERYIITDPEWYKVYGLGIVGNLYAGKIFKNWQVIDKFPNLDSWIGLDFGFSNDPTAAVRVATEQDNIYLEELLYMTDMTNQMVAKALKAAGYSGEIVICDSAEPKSIQELKLMGINAIPADKKPGSINEGIDFLKSKNIFYTKNSANIETEYKHYKWMQDKNGVFLNKPIDMFNHLMDATRYAFSLGIRNTTKKDEDLFIKC